VHSLAVLRAKGALRKAAEFKPTVDSVSKKSKPTYKIYKLNIYVFVINPYDPISIFTSQA
jgi:hypothetical protein